MGLTGPQGPSGAPGQDGVDGFSGYEQVDRAIQNVALPISSTSYFAVDCPLGKKPVGAGYLVQLYNDSGFVGVGSAPIAVARRLPRITAPGSRPRAASSSW